MPQDQFDSFAKSDKQQWREAAKKELGGKDPFEVLSILKGKITINPYYDESDTKQISDFILRESSDPYLGPRGWFNSPIVSSYNTNEANKIALGHLNAGADGVVFKINSTDIQVDKLLQDIELPYCAILFLIDNGQSKFLNDFEQHVDAKGFDKAQILGGVFWKSLPGDISNIIDQFAAWKKFSVLGFALAPQKDCILEMVNGLLAGVDTLSRGTDNGIDAKKIFSQLAFSFTVGTDFFSEIARFKAFRKLWGKIGTAYHINSPDEGTLIHGISNCWNHENYQPNANMLKGTTAALSAILGGCNAISIEPEEENSQFKSRIARNVLTLLREESHLNQTADATAGSYYLDSLTDQIAKMAWVEFQRKMKG